MSLDKTAAHLSCKDLNWQIGQKPILKDINLNLYPGEVLGVIGPNGAGKSSLLKMLAGVEQPSSGFRALNDADYLHFNNKEFAKKVAYLEQHSSVHWPLLVHKVIELGRSPYLSFSQDLNHKDTEAIEHAVAATGIHDLLSRVVTTLSVGERMLVALTRTLATQTQIILADEPVAALDPYHQLLIMELLQTRTRAEQAHSTVVVLHDLNLAARFCDRLVLMDQGSIVSEGSVEAVLTEGNLSRYYKINTNIDHEKNIVLPLSRITPQN